MLAPGTGYRGLRTMIGFTCLASAVACGPDSAPELSGLGDQVAQVGAALTANDGFTATWHWCPTREQQAESRYTLVLTADDGDNPKTIKEFLVVLLGGDGTSCPGTPPAIAHTPHDVSSILDVAIDATVTDDRGIKDAPLVYVSPTQPAT